MCDELLTLHREVEHSRDVLNQTKCELQVALLERPSMVGALHRKAEGAEWKLQHNMKAVYLHRATHAGCDGGQ
jgi:hypothetical protein